VGVACVGGTCGATPSHYLLVNNPAGVTFIDACAAPGATTYLPGVDDGDVQIPLPFAFRYWDTDLGAGAFINVSSNGWISMDGVAGSAPAGAIPSLARPNAVIAPFWHDGLNRTPGQCVATIGTAPDRQWVLEWSNQLYSGSPPDASLTYEIILSETTHEIDFAYAMFIYPLFGAIGIENFVGNAGVNGCSGGQANCMPASGQVMRFQPIP